MTDHIIAMVKLTTETPNSSPSEIASKINKYIRANPEVNSINTRTLNESIKVNDYTFCKRNGFQQLIKKQHKVSINKISPNASSPTIQSSNNDHEPISDRVNMKMNDVEARCKALDEEVIEIRQCIKDITNKIMEMMDTIQGLQKASYGVGNGYALYLNKSFSGN